MNVIDIPISYGEAFDKLSILDIKLHRVTDPERLKQVQHEFALLKSRLAELEKREGMSLLYQQLYYINELIWDVENMKRELELKNRVFTENFCQTAREVYLLNDKRAEIKRSIDRTLSSSIHEVKSHPPYKKGKLLILTHTGLGDLIMCNGLVRYKALLHTEVRLVVPEKYAATVRFMFRDAANITFETFRDLVEISPNYAGRMPDRLAALMRDGYEFLPLGDHSQYTKPDDSHWIHKGYDFCEAFYAVANVPYSVRKRYGFVARDMEREEQLYKAVTAEIGTTYRVIHDDPTRNLVLDRSHISGAMPEFHTATKTLGSTEVWSSNIFDYCTLIERAQEYHGFDSSFFAMLDLIKCTCKSINLHTYVRTLHCKMYPNLTINMVSKEVAPPFMFLVTEPRSIEEIKQLAQTHPQATHIVALERGYKLNCNLHRFLEYDEPFLYSTYAIVGRTEFNEFVIYNARRVQQINWDSIPPRYTWNMLKSPVIQDK